MCEEAAKFAISLLNGEISLQQDTNGDYLVRGNKKQFDLILKYLQSGNVCEPSCSAWNSDDMNSIKDQAWTFAAKGSLWAHKHSWTLPQAYIWLRVRLCLTFEAKISVFKRG